MALTPISDAPLVIATQAIDPAQLAALNQACTDVALQGMMFALCVGMVIGAAIVYLKGKYGNK